MLDFGTSASQQANDMSNAAFLNLHCKAVRNRPACKTMTCPTSKEILTGIASKPITEPQRCEVETAGKGSGKYVHCTHLLSAL